MLEPQNQWINEFYVRRSGTVLSFKIVNGQVGMHQVFNQISEP